MLIINDYRIHISRRAVEKMNMFEPLSVAQQRCGCYLKGATCSLDWFFLMFFPAVSDLNTYTDVHLYVHCLQFPHFMITWMDSI